MALKDIAINIKATGIDQTTQGLKAVEGAAGSMGRKTKSVTQQMREDMERTERSIGHSTGIIARSFEQLSMYVKSATAAFAGFKLTQQIQEATMFAANVQQADRALSVIANTMGRTSEEAMTYRNSLRDLGITTNSATNATAQFIKAGLPLDGLNKLGRAAQGAAISYQMMTGETISSSAALDKMIRALVTGNVTELHTLGINVMMRDTLRENKLATGEASTAVDTHKCHLLMFNDVLEKTEPLMLLYEKSMDLAAKQISSSKRPIEELKLALGNLFLPELTIAATQFYSTVSGGMKWVKSHGEELEATKSAILALSEAMWAAAKIGSSYLLIYKGIPAATAVWGWVTAKTALVAAEFKARHCCRHRSDAWQRPSRRNERRRHRRGKCGNGGGDGGRTAPGTGDDGRPGDRARSCPGKAGRRDFHPGANRSPDRTGRDFKSSCRGPGAAGRCRARRDLGDERSYRSAECARCCGTQGPYQHAQSGQCDERDDGCLDRMGDRDLAQQPI